MTLKDTIYNILISKPECRDSDKKLQWEVLDQLGLIDFDHLFYDSFMKAPEFESVRRCRQALQRSDLLTGKKLIQPTPKVKKQRQILANENGFAYIQGSMPVHNPETQTYEI